MKNIDESSTMRGSLTKTECAQVRRMVLELGEVEASRRIGVGRHVALRAAAELPLSAAVRLMVRSRLGDLGAA